LPLRLWLRPGRVVWFAIRLHCKQTLGKNECPLADTSGGRPGSKPPAGPNNIGGRWCNRRAREVKNRPAGVFQVTHLLPAGANHQS
jgi:hypothetical protein